MITTGSGLSIIPSTPEASKLIAFSCVVTLNSSTKPVTLITIPVSRISKALVELGCLTNIPDQSVSIVSCRNNAGAPAISITPLSGFAYL